VRCVPSCSSTVSRFVGASMLLTCACAPFPMPVSLHRFHAGVLELREGPPGINRLMLPPVADEQHTVVRMEPIHKFMHLPGRCQRGFVEYIEPFLPAIRLLSTNQMLLQRRCLHACVPELLRRAGRRRETFVRSRASTYPLRCRGSSEIKVASDGFTMLISSQAWLAEGDVSVPPLLLQLLEPAVPPPIQVCTSQLFTAHAEVANWPVVCMLADHAQGAETASICKACYARLQERVDCAKAAGPPHRRKRCAQIVCDAVWADPSDPSKTYTNAAARYSRNCASAPEWPA
jgi:hypothetical protein